ncbi:MAG: shikimate dehydrogenase [Rhizomicrobium sp.]
MKLAGVVGWPVGQSLSPLLHGLWIAEYAIAGAYVPLPVRREDFSHALRGLRICGFVGVNATLPHKQAAFAMADVCDQASAAAGAANLLLFHEQGIEARNTDIEGLTAALRAETGGNGIGGVQAVIVGAGGAARASVLVCDRLGAATIFVLNRTPRRANQLVAGLAPLVRAQLSAGSLEDWPAVACATGLLIHATGAGMGGAPSLALPLEALPPTALVCDLVYDPLETPLLARASLRGLRTVDGLGMLMNQAVPAFEALFGVRPTVTAATRHRLEKALHDGR